jgi:hypothetical protein
MRTFSLALALGLLGVLLSSLLVWYIARTWSSFSSDWFVLVCLLPIFGILGGAGLSSLLARDGHTRQAPGWGACLGLALLGGLLAGLANYLAFVITSRTWFAAQIHPEHAEFFYQVFHPWVLPAFYEGNEHGGQTEQTWVFMAGIGVLIGFVTTFWGYRRLWKG